MTVVSSIEDPERECAGSQTGQALSRLFAECPSPQKKTATTRPFVEAATVVSTS